MSFRKRNTGLTPGSSRNSDAASKPAVTALPGVRPSPVDGRPTTSTGTVTLDGLLAGHAGLALGTSLLIEENGTTDYAGALLKFYAAEGVLQGHHLHVVALPKQWARSLPGLAGTSDNTIAPTSQEKMKIAWRYESLGQFSGGQSSRDRIVPHPSPDEVSSIPSVFCHTFDLTKKLAHPAGAVINFLPFGSGTSPFDAVLDALSRSLSSTEPNIAHRVVVPSLLSPVLYPHNTSHPHQVLRFMHGLRALLAANLGRLTAMISLPLSLFPRSSAVVRWVEILNDGVLELSPFPHSSDVEPQSKTSSGVSEDPPQGLLRVHRLPILHDRRSGTASTEDDWTFSLSRRKLSIKPFSLPPIEGDTEAQAGDVHQKDSKADLEF